MIRIGFDARFITPFRTGLGNYTRSLLAGLVAQDSTFEFSLFSDRPEELDDFSSRDNVKIHGVGESGSSDASRAAAVVFQQVSMASSLLGERLDLIHFPYYLEPVLAPPPYIVSILDMDTFLPSGRHSRWTRCYHNSMIRWHARRGAAIVTISDHSRRQIIDHLGVPGDKVHVIHCGLGEVFADADRGAPGESDYFLYAGGLGMRKNLRRLVDAFALARGVTGKKTRLVITGELAEVGRLLKRYTEDAGYGDYVEFTGYITDEELAGLTRGAVASIYPSLNEGFGLPVIESLACGVPVITSRGSAMEEVAGGLAVLVDPLDTAEIAAAIGALIMDGRLAEALGVQGPEHARRFSWDKSARRCLDLYEEILSRKGVFC